MATPTPPSLSPKRTEFIRALSSMLGARTSADPFADSICRAFIVYYDRIMSADSLLKRVMRELRHGALGSAILLRRWIDMRARSDFTDRSLLNRLIDGITRAAKRFSPLIDELNRSKLLLLRAFRSDAPAGATTPVQSLRSLAAGGERSFFESDPTLIAKAMADSNARSFGAIPLHELGVRAGDPKFQARAPHLAADIARSDRISSWVATNVLFQHGAKAQERAIHHFVKIAFFAVQIGDLAGSTAIMNGFTLNVVGRLFRHIWHVSSAMCSMAAAPQRIASATHDYEALRKEIEARRAAAQPVVPFLGYYLKKLEAADAGNPWVLAPSGDLNTAKFEVLGRLLGDIEAMQRVAQRAYSPPPNCRYPPLIAQMLERMPRRSDDELERRSCEMRPRGNADAESISTILFATNGSSSSSRSDNSENESASGGSDRDMTEVYD